MTADAMVMPDAYAERKREARLSTTQHAIESSAILGILSADTPDFVAECQWVAFTKFDISIIGDSSQAAVCYPSLKNTIYQRNSHAGGYGYCMNGLGPVHQLRYASGVKH